MRVACLLLLHGLIYKSVFFRNVMQNLISIFSFLLLLAPAFLPSSLAYRDGARSDSCYGHEIMHRSSNPMVGDLVRQECLPPCRFDLDLIGRFDVATQQIIDHNITSFECGEVYECKYVQ